MAYNHPNIIVICKKIDPSVYMIKINLYSNFGKRIEFIHLYSKSIAYLVL